MKLQEKIVYYRKRAGMNQEALAEKLGVSRQAVSKWETGEAVPELGKVVLLAKVFNVTTDELLMDGVPEVEEPAEEPAPQEDYYTAPETQPANWVESIPGVIGRLLRRYGWLSGVYIAVMGALFAGMGALAKRIAGGMVSDFGNTLDGMGFGAGTMMFMDGQMVDVVSQLNRSNPVSIMSSFVIGLGVVMMIGGAVLAIALRKFGKNQ